jgi:hypothetical protein
MSMIIDGTNGLTFNNATTQASAGNVLQVVNATFATSTTTTSTSYQASGLTASITPRFSTSKILVAASVPYDTYGGTSNQASLTLYRGATNLITNGFSIIGGAGALNIQAGSSGLSWLDSPATTSSTTYTIYFRAAPTSSGGAVARIFVDSYAGSITLMEIAA